MCNKKVVFEDAGRTKVAFGKVTEEFGFLKVTDNNGRSILINKKHITSISDR